MLRWIFKKYVGGVDWNHLTKRRDKLRDLVIAEVNILIHKMRGISLLTEVVLASKEFCSME